MLQFHDNQVLESRVSWLCNLGTALRIGIDYLLLYVAIKNAMFHTECQLTPYPRLWVCDPVPLGEWFATFRRHYSGSKRATRPGTLRHIPEEP
jgi:hypothetical protein